MLRDQLNSELKNALKTKQTLRLSTLRLILAAIKDADIAARSEEGNYEGIAEKEIFEILRKMITQRNKSIDIFLRAKRQDLADQEQEEINIISSFLPPPLSEEEIAHKIDCIIQEVEATSIKDMKKVLTLLKERFGECIDIVQASQIASEKLLSKA